MFDLSKKLVASVSLAFVFLFAGPALAQSLTPTGPFTAEGWGTVNNGNITITCDVVFEGEAYSDATIDIDSATFTDGGGNWGFLCPSVGDNTPWTGQVDSTTQITIDDVELTAPLQPDCGPDDIVTDWTNGDPNSTSDPALIEFNNTVLGNCLITDGELEVTHDATGVGLEYSP